MNTWSLNLSQIMLLILIVTAVQPSCVTKEKKQGKSESDKTVNYLSETEFEKETRMAWWKDARFGMFIHWGLYAVPAGEYKGKRDESIGEWIMDHLQIPIAEYEQFAAQFNPEKFDADQWVALAKDAGMKYIVITSKHHDGFALWDSKVSQWDVVDATPFKRDILKELAEACEKQGIRLCFYHSIMDWHHPDAQAIWEPDYNQGRESTNVNPRFPNYLENYMKPQLKELIDNYGDVGILWFDGEWIPAYTTEMGKEIYNYVRNLKPDIIINNRVDKGRQGMQGLNSEGDYAGDYGTPEQEIPDTGLPGVDWESCMTMNDTWGYKYFDDNWKSSETLIRNLIDIVSKGGNFLLNVGPTAEGLIPQESVERLQDMGDWMDLYSASIYGASASPFEKPVWGRFTQKENKIYAHVFDWPSNGILTIPPVEGFKTAYLLSDANKNPLEVNALASGIELVVPVDPPHPIASVIVIEK